MMLYCGNPDFASAAELSDGLHKGLQEYVTLRNGHIPVTTEGETPALNLLHVNLNDARVDWTKLPPKPSRTRESRPAVSASRLVGSAKPLYLADDARAELAVDAQGTELTLVTDKGRRQWLALDRAERGTASMAIHARDLEGLLVHGAGLAAHPYGVTVEKGDVSLKQVGRRAVTLEAEIIARKLLMKSTVLVRGRVDLDDELQAHFSDLKCTGKGPISSIAARFVNPLLESWEQQPLPLLGLLFTDVNLHDITLQVSPDGLLTAQADFGE